MLSELKQREIRRKRRTLHIKCTVRGSSEKPRLSVFRSNKHISAQLIDDEKQVTLLGVGTMSKPLKQGKYGAKSKEAAQQLGKILAEEAKKRKIDTIVFDRSHYKYHGIIAALADAVREAGLKF